MSVLWLWQWCPGCRLVYKVDTIYKVYKKKPEVLKVALFTRLARLTRKKERPSVKRVALCAGEDAGHHCCPTLYLFSVLDLVTR